MAPGRSSCLTSLFPAGTTTDGMHFDFQGQGDFWSHVMLVSPASICALLTTGIRQGSNGDFAKSTFKAQMRYQPCYEGATVTCNYAFAFQEGSNRIVSYFNPDAAIGAATFDVWFGMTNPIKISIPKNADTGAYVPGRDGVC